jgi:hypothetical protein
MMRQDEKGNPGEKLKAEETIGENPKSVKSVNGTHQS